MKKNKKELIRETAIDVFARLGYHNATTDKVAQEAGVAVGTIYNYFRSKEEILEYIFLVELEKRSRFYKEIKDQDIPVMDKFRALLNKHFAEIAESPETGQILVRERQFPDKNDLTAITRFIDGIPQCLEQLLAEAIRRGEIRNCDPRILGAALFGAVQAVVSTAVFEKDQALQKHILSRAADELIEFIKGGLQ